MGIDASIYNALGRGVKSVADYDQEAQASQLNALQLQQGRMKADEYARGLADQAALRQATQGFGADQTANYNALLRTGNLQAAQGYQKSLQESQKTAADTKLATSHASLYDVEAAAKQADAKYTAIQRHAQDVASVQTPDDVVRYVNQSADIMGIPPEQRQQIIAKSLQTAQQLGLDGWKQTTLQGAIPVVEKFKTDAENARNLLNNQTSAANNAATNKTHLQTANIAAATSMRGQDLVNARAKESTAATLTKPFEVTGPDGVPMLVQQDKQGNITPVQGFGPKAGASKPLNDSQAKALGFGTRMQEADKLLNALGAKGVSTPSIAKLTVGDAPVLGAIANAMSSPDQQSVDQAQRDFVNAILRRESGAAISTGEFDNARKQYFPQPGDSAQVKTQKAANRKLAMEGVLAEVPKGQRGTIGPQASSAHPPEIADLLNKYGAK